MFNFIKYSKIWFTFSGLLIAASIIFISLGGIKLGIDFTGGSLIQVSYSPVRPEASLISEAITPTMEHFQVQAAGDNEYILRFENMDEAKHQEILNVLRNIPQAEGNQFEELRFESIGPVVGQELQSKAIQAVILVLIFIVIYIAFAFRKVSQPVASWKYGLSAIIALAHNVIVVMGIFALLGYFFGIEVDILFVTALLTVLGFSVHDTIVTFDRTRENLFKRHGQNFEQIVNDSINETLVRSLNTSAAGIFVLFSIFLFGGESLKYFAFALMMGLIVGTYTSIFIASPILVIWNKFAKK